MSIPILLGLLVAFAAASFVVAPLLFPRAFGIGVAPTAPASAADEEEALLALRDDLYARIVDLDFEYAVGKADEEEYAQERAALKRRALAVLRTLDERAAGADALGDAVEREVHRARARRAETAAALDGVESPDLDDEVERQLRALRYARRSDVARVE
jgi:hypothetical protein